MAQHSREAQAKQGCSGPTQQGGVSQAGVQWPNTAGRHADMYKPSMGAVAQHSRDVYISLAWVQWPNTADMYISLAWVQWPNTADIYV